MRLVEGPNGPRAADPNARRSNECSTRAALYPFTGALPPKDGAFVHRTPCPPRSGGGALGVCPLLHPLTAFIGAILR